MESDNLLDILEESRSSIATNGLVKGLLAYQHNLYLSAYIFEELWHIFINSAVRIEMIFKRLSEIAHALVSPMFSYNPMLNLHLYLTTSFLESNLKGFKIIFLSKLFYHKKRRRKSKLERHLIATKRYVPARQGDLPMLSRDFTNYLHGLNVRNNLSMIHHNSCPGAIGNIFQEGYFFTRLGYIFRSAV